MLGVWEFTALTGTTPGGAVLLAGTVTVTVREEVASGSPPLAALYSDKEGATPLGNPFFSTSLSDVKFYAERNKLYRITFTSASFSRTLRHQSVSNAEVSDDEFLGGDEPSDDVVPTQAAVKTYIDSIDLSLPVVPFQVPFCVETGAITGSDTFQYDPGTGTFTLMPDANENPGDITIVAASHVAPSSGSSPGVVNGASVLISAGDGEAGGDVVLSSGNGTSGSAAGSAALQIAGSDALRITPDADLSGSIIATTMVGATHETLPTSLAVKTYVDAGDASIAAHLADTTDAHDASAISFVPPTGETDENVQDALDTLFEAIATGVSDGDKGDITVTGGAWAIDNNVVSYAKIQDVSATSRVLGRATAGAGDPEELTLSQLLDFVGSAAQGDILYRGSSAWARLAAGTSGRFLQTLGAAASPAWAAAVTPSNSLAIIKCGGVNITQNATRYLRPVGQAGDNPTETNTRVQLRQAVTISELRAKLSAAVPASQSITFTLRKNGVDTALTFTIGAGATTGADTVNSVSFDAGDWLAIKAVTSATFTSTIDVNVTAVSKVPNSDYAAPIIGFGNMGFGSAGYLGEPGGTQFATESHAQVPLRRCVFARFYATDNTAPMDLFLRRNGVSASVQVSVPVAAGQLQTTGGSDLNAHVFDTNDLLSFIQNNVVSTNGTAVLQNEGNPYDIYAPSFFASQGQAQATTRYMGGWNASSASATESDVNIPMPACVAHGLRVHASAAPPSGQTCVITVRKNGVDTSLTVTITDAGTTFSNTGDTVTFAADDLLSISCVSSATAGTLSYTASLEFSKAA